MQAYLLEIEPAQPFSILAEMSSGPDEVRDFIAHITDMTSEGLHSKADKHSALLGTVSLWSGDSLPIS